jgi:hypothetical protein
MINKIDEVNKADEIESDNLKHETKNVNNRKQ